MKNIKRELWSWEKLKWNVLHTVSNKTWNVVCNFIHNDIMFQLEYRLKHVINGVIR